MPRRAKVGSRKGIIIFPYYDHSIVNRGFFIRLIVIMFNKKPPRKMEKTIIEKDWETFVSFLNKFLPKVFMVFLYFLVPIIIYSIFYLLDKWSIFTFFCIVWTIFGLIQIID